MANISPKIWGPSAWRLIHLTAAKTRTYADLAIMRSFVEGLEYLLPCTKCRASFAAHLSQLPFPSRPRDLPQWAYDMHNRVNLSSAGSAGSEPSAFSAPDPAEVFEAYRKMAKARQSSPFAAFLAALADAHPGRRGRKAYTAALGALLALLEHFYKVTPPPTPIRSPRAFRAWLGLEGAPRTPSKCKDTCVV